VERARQLIKQAITSLQLSPQVPVQERALARQIGLPEESVREALQRLTDEGWLTLDRSGRLRVSASTQAAVLQQLYELRALLEGYCARLAAERISPDQVSTLIDILDEFERLADKSDNQTILALDRKFHAFVWEAANNVFLQETLEHLYDLSMRVWYLALDRMGSIRSVLAEHHDLVRALKDGDAAQAEKLLRQHVNSFHSAIKPRL